MEREQEQDRSLEELFGGVPDAIFVLSGGIVKSELSNGAEQYRSPSFSGNDVYGLLSGGRYRVVAAAEAAKQFPKADIITTSQVERDAPTHAAVMARELMAYGVEAGRVKTEERSFDTESELIEMVKMAARADYTNVGVMTNEYHVGRVEAFLKKLEERADPADHEFFDSHASFKRERNVAVVSAEDVLVKRNPRYIALIENVKKSSEYKHRLEMERRGVEQIKDGSYVKYYEKPLARDVGYFEGH